jgi:CDP-glucose 4,6-dehydratase
VLNSQKAKKLLKWKPLWNIEKTIKLTADWYRSYLLNEDMKEVTLKQINNFLSNKKK